VFINSAFVLSIITLSRILFCVYCCGVPASSCCWSTRIITSVKYLLCFLITVHFVNMVFKCSAYGCRSGYDSQVTDKTVTFHAFPSDPEIRRRWITANPRKDFVPTQHSRICSLHFQPSDFSEIRTDTNKRRLKTVSVKRQRRHLNEDAVPSIFSNAPDYYTKPARTPRQTTKATSSSRRQDEVNKMEELERSFRENDDVSSLSLADISAKLSDETSLPPGFNITIMDDSLLVYLLHLNDGVPTVSACITLKSDLTVVCSLRGKVVPASQYGDLVKDRLTQISQLVNLMARLKSWYTDPSSASLSLHVLTAVNELQKALDYVPDSDSEQHRKLRSLTEQLHLLLNQKYGRHYSPELTIFAFLVHASSPSAYRVLLEENVLCLPSTNILKKVTRRLRSVTTVDNSAYLQLRLSQLNEPERTVTLIIDEIYIAKRVEYSSGGVQGLTADGSVASTLLCFMVKSLASKYKDIVAIYPMDKLTAVKLFDCYNEVMNLLRK